MTQRVLANRAQTPQPAVARYEAGEVVPRADTLERLLAACGRPIAGAAPEGSRALLGPVGYRLARNRDAVLEAARVAGAHRVRVFGSVARAEDTETSDVDLLVDLEPGRTLLDLVGLGDVLTTLLGVGVDVATEDILKPAERERALTDARLL